MTISLDSLTSNPVGTENGLVTRNIPSGIQVVEITDGYGHTLGTSTNPISTIPSSSTRTTLTFYCVSESVPYATEGMLTLTPTRNFVAGTPATSFGVTPGKTLRIQSILETSGDGEGFSINLRASNSGAVTTSSLLVCPYIKTNGFTMFFLDDGLELSGNMQFGISAVQFDGSDNTTLYVVGYEY